MDDFPINKNRQPLSKSEMSETLAELLESNDFTNDLNRAHFLAGLKVGILSGLPMEQEEALQFCQMVFLRQISCDPDGTTWGKS